MGYEHQCPLILPEDGFQRFLRRNIHVVGRLVQKQQIRPLFQEHCQNQPGLLSA